MLFHYPARRIFGKEIQHEFCIGECQDWRKGGRSSEWLCYGNSKGEGEVELDGILQKVKNGIILDIPVEQKHRIANTGKDPLIFIEVACGDYLGEDDITRIEDDYAR